MRTFFNNCRLVDGTGARAVESALVVVTDDQITWCGPADAAEAPTPVAGDRQVDLAGRTLLPGLFNVHVHLALRLPFPEQRIDPFAPGYRAMLIYRRALEAIYSGTTSLRAVGEAHFMDIAVRNAINKGVLPGPRIQSAGSALIATGGHGHNSVSCIEADGVDGFRRAAREQLRAGADLIKICLTGGIGTPGEQPADKQMSDDEVAAVVEVAHGANKRVASHTGGSQPVKDAVRLGVDCIEHGYQFDEEAAQMMAEAGTFLVPTLCVTQELDYMRRHGVQEWMLTKARAAAVEHLNSIRRAVAAGVTLCVGTDLLPSDPVDGTVATIREVELLVEAGLSPLDALRAATFNSARLCGVERLTGTIAAGKQADLIVVDGRPDVEIRDLRQVRLVMKDGAVFRNELPNLDAPGLALPGVELAGGTFARVY
ncbi:amidohydrolase family protein [Litorilinea aerophila]|uniref:Amidohydrolase family protein n=1 Tax=Litorilinea aerophila TaxID=1204385 RepID=A0A540VI41_9CHLR|nr:amidohydrolase family protein [Litorilinea aerophila]MCC9076078.1 amidohydrolase family protein [Litorilinea aerophila]